jgi:hypothetical protein
VALLITVAALLAPASLSKPNSAEYITERKTDQVLVMKSEPGHELQHVAVGILEIDAAPAAPSVNLHILL